MPKGTPQPQSTDVVAVVGAAVQSGRRENSGRAVVSGRESAVQSAYAGGEGIAAAAAGSEPLDCGIEETAAVQTAVASVRIGAVLNKRHSHVK